MKETEFSKHIKITYPECDVRNQIKLSAMMRHVQELSGEHLEALGLAHTMLWQEGFVYLLTRLKLTLTRRPAALEALTLRTLPRKPKGVQSFRDVFFCDAQGQELVRAVSAWVLTDPVEHRIRRPAELPHQIPLEDCDYDYSWSRERIRRPENAQIVGHREVRYSDLDVNMHMNNAIYGDIVCDCLPLELHRQADLVELMIEFAGEVQLGDDITLYAAQTADDIWYIGGDKSDGTRCFEAKWQSIRASV